VFIAVLVSSVEIRISKDVKENQQSISKLIKEETDQMDEEVEEGVSQILSELGALKTELATLQQAIQKGNSNS